MASTAAVTDDVTVEGMVEIIVYEGVARRDASQCARASAMTSSSVGLRAAATDAAGVGAAWAPVR
jgi:hypothetical protein